MKKKQFKDPVHGYVWVRADWCSDFVDTPIFQRLRHIEQTTMRPLYPAAHHDRFIHSLGTYHLGCRLFEELQKNTQEREIQELLKQPTLKNTFLIACLMHDCGHAPFSHALEGFYNYTEAETVNRAYQLLSSEFGGKDFSIDEAFLPQPHEALSAVVLKRFYSEELSRYDCDVELAARMITGCTYPVEVEQKEQVYNSMISLLNGNAIDVDKLDYLLRDTWASGIHNVAIDIDRILSSISLHCDKDEHIRLCYKKSALSVIQSVVDARNYLHKWTYNHHTVVYYVELLDRAMRRLAQHLEEDGDPDSFWKAAFSLVPFECEAKITDNISVHLLTDGDILHLLKRFKDDIPEVEELISHSPNLIPLWKTYAEFCLKFEGWPVTQKEVGDNVTKNLPKRLAEHFQAEESNFMAVAATPSHYAIDGADVLIQIEDDIEPFTELAGTSQTGNPPYYFYVFVTPKYREEKDEIVKIIRSQRR